MDQVARDVALRRLDAFVGEWTLEAVFPNNPAEVLRGGRSAFEWMKGGQLLVQRTEAPAPEAPDSIAIIAVDRDQGEYTQHYFDSRGVVRLYAMTLSDNVWTLVRDSPDFSPWDFAQRFTGTLTDDNTTIRGVWERSTDGRTWEKDFDLTYRRIP
jgi:hypothetical protein